MYVDAFLWRKILIRLESILNTYLFLFYWYGITDKFVQNISKATPSQVYGAFRKRDAVEIADEVDKSKRSISTKPILWTQESSVSKGEAIIALLEDDIALWTHGEHLAPRYHNSL